jgi:transcriptional regulator with XRE-family HTH domain
MSNTSALAEYRKRKGMSQEEAAEAVGKSRSGWDAWEHLRRPVSAVDFGKIRKLLKLSDEEANILIEEQKQFGAELTLSHIAQVKDAIGMTLPDTMVLLEELETDRAIVAGDEEGSVSDP